MNAKIITILVCLVVAAIISLQNTGQVTVSILFWDITPPLVLVVYILLAIGFIGGFFTASYGRRKKEKNRDTSGDDSRATKAR